MSEPTLLSFPDTGTPATDAGAAATPAPAAITPDSISLGCITLAITAHSFAETLYLTDLPGISITASTPDGESKGCRWDYLDRGVGSYTFNHAVYDGSSPSHVEFREWLKAMAGVGSGAADLAMAGILDLIATPDVYAGDTGALYAAIGNGEAAILVQAGTAVDGGNVYLYGVRDRFYAGFWGRFGNDEEQSLLAGHGLPERVKVAVDAVANEHPYASSDRHFAITETLRSFGYTASWDGQGS